MVQINVSTNTARKIKNVEITSTPAQVFSELEISTANAMINLDGTILSAVDINSSFEALGVQDGSSVNLNCIIKADGARK